MKVNNRFLYNIYFSNSQSSLAFGRKKEDDSYMKLRLSDAELTKIQQLSDTYEKTTSSLSKFNGIYQKKIKSSFPEMITIDNVKGFLFNSLVPKQKEPLQLIKINARKTSPELVTFNILGEKNTPLMQFRIGKDGVASIKKEENISQQQLEETIKKKNLNYIDTIINSLKNIDFYANNYNILSKQARFTNKTDISETISDYEELQKSEGLKTEIERIKDKNAELFDLLFKKRTRDTFPIKKAFMGDVITEKTKGFIFKNALPNNRTISFYPFHGQTDNRTFRIIILNDKNEKESCFVFFDDGKITKQREGMKFDKDMRPNKLNTLSDKDLEKYNVKELLETTENKLAEFIDFVNEYRSTKKHRNNNTNIETEKQNNIPDTKAANRKKTAESAKEIKRIEKETKIQQKQAELEKRTRLKEQKAEERQKQRAEKLAQKLAKKQAAENEKFLNKKTKVKKQNTNNYLPKELRVQKILKTQETSQKTETSMQKKISTEDVQKAVSFDSIAIFEISQKLTDIFNTAVENRSSHLIHEKLSNGKIFGGRFSLTTNDGSQITVSRMKSPRYVEFVYYSIRLTPKNGQEFVLNIDPVMGRIIENTPEGKPFIDKKNNVRHISKENFLKQNPSAINLPQYFSEIFATRNDKEREIIKFKKSNTTYAQLLKQKEIDIQKALQAAPDISDDFQE